MLLWDGMGWDRDGITSLWDGISLPWDGMGQDQDGITSLWDGTRFSWDGMGQDQDGITFLRDGTENFFVGWDGTRSLWDGSSRSRPGSTPGPGWDKTLVGWELPSRSRGQPRNHSEHEDLLQVCHLEIQKLEKKKTFNKKYVVFDDVLVFDWFIIDYQ